MKNFKKLMMLAVLSIGAQQNIFADSNDDKMYDDQIEPKHQGLGRIFTGAENVLTLHPGNAVNALATGNQADTSFGWHKDEDDKVKANRAHTKHNKNKKEQEQKEKNKKNKKQKEEKNKKDQKKKDNQQQKEKNKKKEVKPKKNKSQSQDNSKPKHQGFGRIGTAFENTLTLHPGNAVNALATGDQADTNFGWHEDEDNRIKANRANTRHNQPMLDEE